MLAVLKSLMRFLAVGWFWAFILLALPNCILDASGIDCENPDCAPDPCDPAEDPECEPPPCDPEDPECLPPPVAKAFDAGEDPHDAIFCDFPMPLVAGDDGCANSQQISDGMSYAYAAVALVQGQGAAIALDYSPGAIAACGGPKRTEFMVGTFPHGETVCLNCGTQIDEEKYPTPLDACIARCRDAIDFDFFSPAPPEGSAAFCQAHAKLSINTEQDTCYMGACTNGGPNAAFDDPRKHQEKVVWIDTSPGVETFGAGTNGLRRIAPATGVGDADFNEGGASAQTITRGDGWVEFDAGENGVSHIVGLRESCADPMNCEDDDYGLTGIGHALSLNNDNNIYVLEQGTPLFVHAVLDSYTDTQRFRVEFTDNNNDTATITYYRLTGPCADGTVCAKEHLYTSTTTPHYPLRVDAIFREQNASVDNVTIVRIKQ